MTGFRQHWLIVFLCHFFETQCVNIRLCTFIHASSFGCMNMRLCTFICASSFGRQTRKNMQKNDIFLYAYMQILAGTQCVSIFLYTFMQEHKSCINAQPRSIHIYVDIKLDKLYVYLDLGPAQVDIFLYTFLQCINAYIGCLAVSKTARNF
jgi:hypothetical protein